MGTSVEHRQEKRYRLAAAVSFSWETTDRVVGQGHGLTRDCSISGAFVITSDHSPVGSIVQMEVTLPPLQAAGHGARLKTNGRVVRSEPQGFAMVDMGLSSRLQAAEERIRTRLMRGENPGEGGSPLLA